jgi:hypothetical protein
MLFLNRFLEKWGDLSDFRQLSESVEIFCDEFDGISSNIPELYTEIQWLRKELKKLLSLQF